MNSADLEPPMLNWSKLWRLFIASLSLQAFTMGFLATLLASGLWKAAPATFAALDWTAYDTWLRHRTSIEASSDLAVVFRDSASGEYFGRGPLDRGILAVLISAGHEAGASAIGVDHRLDQASSVQLGGAASDALLMEAVQNAGPVVMAYAESVPPFDATIPGHLLLIEDSDHVARRLPLLFFVDQQAVPAFGAVLYDLYRQQIPPTTTHLVIEGKEPALINPVGNGSLASLITIPMSSVWDAVQHQEDAKLDEWFKGKVVVFVGDPHIADRWLLPTGQSVNGMTAHLHFLNSLLTNDRLRQAGPIERYSVTILLTALAAWFLLRFHGSVGLLFAGGVIGLYGLLTAVILGMAHLVLPVALPFTAGVIVLLGSTGWTHLTAGQRMLLLERDMLRIQQEAAAVREALILRENRVEALQEDLEAAKTEVAQSVGRQQELTDATESLRSQIAEVQTQEQSVRRQLESLEQQLHDLRAAGTELPVLNDEELERLRKECLSLGIVTRDPSLLRLFHDVKKGARSHLPVLLLGEPGTGKELFARAVHRLSPRAGKTFIAVNMAAISPELFESELFGHTKGSFTGAMADRRGYFELANHGTIFLDEIGDLRLDHQGKLLRVLQEKSFYRVGATMPTTVDVRVVAATNRDLQRGVSESWFREDLYFRLKGLVFRLPPLRERTGDVPTLAEACLAEIATQMGRPVPKLSHDALRLLSGHPWPGNIREFRHALERSVVLHDEQVLTQGAFHLEDRATATERMDRTSALPDPASDAAVLNCLRQHGFDMQATAKTLGWDRSTVTQRLKGLCFQALVESNGDQANAAMSIAGDPSHLRTVELKLMDYHGHLVSVIKPFTTCDEALVDCKRRFKNLPDRHFKSVERLVRQYFHQAGKIDAD